MPLRKFAERLRQRFDHRNLRRKFSELEWPLKLLLAIALLLLVIQGLPAVFLVLGFWLGVLYGLYWLVWRLVAGRKRPAWTIAIKPSRQRFTELIGSLVASTLTAAVMSAVALVIESYWDEAAGSPRPEQFAWLLLASGVGAWAVLATTKPWEGRRGDPVLRRFVLMVIGMGVGMAAFGLAEMLLVSLPPAAGYPQPPGYRLPLSFYAVDGRPLLTAYVACFGTLFLFVGWWRQTDLLRSKWLSLGARGGDRPRRGSGGVYVAFSATMAADGRRHDLGCGAVGQPLAPAGQTAGKGNPMNNVRATSRTGVFHLLALLLVLAIGLIVAGLLMGVFVGDYRLVVQRAPHADNAATKVLQREPSSPPTPVARGEERSPEAAAKPQAGVGPNGLPAAKTRPAWVDAPPHVVDAPTRPASRLAPTRPAANATRNCPMSSRRRSTTTPTCAWTKLSPARSACPTIISANA